MSNTKPKIFNIKKCQKREAKKRKLEAFLNLVREDDLTSVNPKKKSSTTFAESYKALKDELKKYQKKKEVDPVFYLTNVGRSAEVKLRSEDDKLRSQSPLFVEDIYHLLLKSVLGNVSPFPLRWAKLEQANSINKTVLIEIGHLTEQSIIKMNSTFKENFLLPHVLEVVSTDQAFSTELCSFHSGSDSCSPVERSYSYMFPMDQASVNEAEDIKQPNEVSYKVSKLHLLLSPIQLAMEHYPLPQSIFEQSKSDGYCFSKDSYSPVHADSPMFAIDCEMCLTETGKQEVTRIAIINEKLETVYHTLVKPNARIVDYITRFSGITEKMLRDVKTTLSDVHRDIKNILPSDAILCGQSLNCDLHGLKMIHPYVIDTSVIYNENGIRQKKTSLKQLSLIHLKESIQEGKRGHNPVEDSIATMKLVQLKLRNSLKYGDAVLSPDFGENYINASDNERNNNTVLPLQTMHTNESTSSASKANRFFLPLSRFNKKVCLIGDENALINYNQDVITDNVAQVNKSGIKKIMKASVENLNSNDLIISHLVSDAESSSVIELNNEIKEFYDSCPSKTLFIILMSDINNSSVQGFRHNLCMVTLKC